ncbi:hypothetical protein EDD16DRAFT_906842 [Pisolithus croceorrhizus]|nr:hypothetical protein EDD16DRAFT_906842 [Pisolithus croceorrhizus]KAI6123282.1 hypothetical protein EV401DRAFT_1947604 [Pisolithus croceorrhizus]
MSHSANGSLWQYTSPKLANPVLNRSLLSVHVPPNVFRVNVTTAHGDRLGQAGTCSIGMNIQKRICTWDITDILKRTHGDPPLLSQLDMGPSLLSTNPSVTWKSSHFNAMECLSINRIIRPVRLSVPVQSRTDALCSLATWATVRVVYPALVATDLPAARDDSSTHAPYPTPVLDSHAASKSYRLSIAAVFLCSLRRCDRSGDSA